MKDVRVFLSPYNFHTSEQFCKKCTELKEGIISLGGFGGYGGYGEDWKLDYETWAKENFSFTQEILEKKQSQCN